MSDERNTRHLLTPRCYPERVSVVMPMYNEECIVELLRREVTRFAGELQGALEVVLVNDGSTDGTLDKIATWAAEDSRIRVVHLSRNFGHQLAATAGLDHATGDAIVLIDADLQDPLEVIHAMIERYCQGYDVVYGQRESRAGETLSKRFTAWAFYRAMRALVYKNLPVDTGDFRLISRECLSGLQQMRETHRFLRGMVAWVGYPQVAVPYHRLARTAGKTKYPLSKMIAFAWTAATSFSTLPLKLSIINGILVGLFGIEEAVRAVLAHFLGWYAVSGWASLTILTSLIGSSLLIGLGILGEYIGKLYEQAKNRPLYLVARTINVTPTSTSKQSNLVAYAGDTSHS